MDNTCRVVEEELHIVNKFPDGGSKFYVDIGFSQCDDLRPFNAPEDVENPFPACLPRLKEGKRYHNMPFKLALC